MGDGSDGRGNGDWWLGHRKWVVMGKGIIKKVKGMIKFRGVGKKWVCCSIDFKHLRGICVSQGKETGDLWHRSLLFPIELEKVNGFLRLGRSPRYPFGLLKASWLPPHMRMRMRHLKSTKCLLLLFFKWKYKTNFYTLFFFYFCLS